MTRHVSSSQGRALEELQQEQSRLVWRESSKRAIFLPSGRFLYQELLNRVLLAMSPMTVQQPMTSPMEDTSPCVFLLVSFHSFSETLRATWTTAVQSVYLSHDCFVAQQVASRTVRGGCREVHRNWSQGHKGAWQPTRTKNWGPRSQTLTLKGEEWGPKRAFVPPDKTCLREGRRLATSGVWSASSLASVRLHTGGWQGVEAWQSCAKFCTHES